MTAPPRPPRPFFLPMLGLVLLFAALGPAIGGASFIPLAFWLEAPLASPAIAHLGWIATWIGHALALIPAYLVGIGPAAVTGFAYALWDAWAPPRLPRALAAAAIGGAAAYGMFAWLASLAAGFETSLSIDVSSATGSWMDDLFSGEFDAALQKALVASGAIAGFACACVASLLRLTTAEPPTDGPR